MPRHYFAIPALQPQPAQDELNAFCAAHRVVQVDQQWLADGAGSHWAVCVVTADGPGPLPAALKAEPGKPAGRPDHKEVLGNADFQRFARLRTWRKQAAQQAGAPVYAVFTNDQLAEVVDCLADLDGRLNRLAASILTGQAPLGLQRQFTIHDPKRRLITAACLDDRVLHHAILNLAEPRFECMLVHGTYACRPGKGVHAAVAAVQQHLRQAQAWPWFVKVDVDAYFPVIDHAVLKALLARRFKGDDFLALLGRIIDAGAPVPPGQAPGQAVRRGLPIGALTSQHFANAYLDGADRFLLDHPGVAAAVRYMDDMVWWCPSLAAAQDSLAGLGDWLLRERRLRLKPGVQIGRSAQGLQYCGFRIRPGVLLASARKLSRYRAGLRRIGQALASDAASPAQAQRAHDGTLAILAAAQTLGFRQRLLADGPRHPPQGCGS